MLTVPTSNGQFRIRVLPHRGSFYFSTRLTDSDLADDDGDTFPSWFDEDQGMDYSDLEEEQDNASEEDLERDDIFRELSSTENDEQLSDPSESENEEENHHEPLTQDGELLTQDDEFMLLLLKDLSGIILPLLVLIRNRICCSRGVEPNSGFFYMESARPYR